MGPGSWRPAVTVPLRCSSEASLAHDATLSLPSRWHQSENVRRRVSQDARVMRATAWAPARAGAGR